MARFQKLRRWGLFICFMLGTLGIIFELRNLKVTVQRGKEEFTMTTSTITPSCLHCTLASDGITTKARNYKSKPGHVILLGPNSSPINTSVFPIKHMPAPRLDKTETYVGKKEISELYKDIKFVVKKHPSWKFKNSTDIGKLLSSQKEEISMDVFNKTVRLLSIITLPYQENRTFHFITGMLSFLTQKKFPTQRRQLTCNNCFPYDFKNVISPKALCMGRDAIVAVIMITTIPRNAQQRMIIRRTWASDGLQKMYNYRVIFLFGYGWPEDQIDKLRKENAEHNDILMDDFIDNYYNLSQKVLMGFRWILHECPKTQFVIRAADDTSMRIPEMFSLIQKYGNDEAFQKQQVGHCVRYQSMRKPGIKWFINTLEYDRDTSPVFAVGTVFITSVNLTRELVEISPNIPYLALEDMYFGLALEQLGRGCLDIKGWYGQYVIHNFQCNMVWKRGCTW